MKNRQIILLGEMHGTKEIPRLFLKWIKEISKKHTVVVCLEIPKEYQNNIDSYFLDEQSKGGGLATKAYYSMIAKLKELGIKRYCIDELCTTQQEKEDTLARNIIEVSKKEEKMIVILGEVHASKKPTILQNKKIFPAGYLIDKALKGKMVSIRIVPKNGTYFSETIRTVSYSSNDPLNAHFDKICTIKKISPSFLR